VKYCFGFLLLIVSFESDSQKSIDGNVAFLKKFFSDYAPCIENFYCNEYSFDVVKGQLQIDLKLYNYKNRVKFLKESSRFVIPINQIKKVDYFLNYSEDIFIVAKGDFIVKTSRGKKEFFSALPLDFNKYKLTKALKSEFEKNLNSVIGR
jgi:hypothetical protein